jgi:hypothetical protein
MLGLEWTRRDSRLWIFVYSLVHIAGCVVEVCTLGFVCCKWSALFAFSDFGYKLENWCKGKGWVL